MNITEWRGEIKTDVSLEEKIKSSVQGKTWKIELREKVESKLNIPLLGDRAKERTM